ncbi:trans-aconitate 2-methyltransferase [Hamadaea tsunoensis]|uniref:trans-aconitate 2-methyltransferase n=1 Tax=Hamadaea tsunoensis TaxID=53368 RepID=UPI00040D9BBD|nr:trans-aconitate 2-methyltransferase [Hamadaea tsunoensis]
MWDPQVYQRYGDERSRPFFDLIGRVYAERPARVVDAGCGPGTLTATLARRWPAARISGFDSSAEMIAAARELGSDVDFAVADVLDWTPDPDVDVIVSNAVLQWVPGHRDLLARWAAALKPGGWIAYQVPGNFSGSSHLLARELNESPEWRPRLGPAVRDDIPVAEPAEYARDLLAYGLAGDVWETTYLHQLPAADDVHPVLRWMEGTALRPVKAALGGDPGLWQAYREQLTGKLEKAYPVESGVVIFPFRRIFVVGRKGL